MRAVSFCYLKMDLDAKPLPLAERPCMEELVDENDDDHTYVAYMHRAIEMDDKDLFVNMINILSSRGPVPADTRLSMLVYDAANCAEAVLAGKTAPKFHFSDESSGVASYTLLDVVGKAAPRLTALLLANNVQVDTRGDYPNRYLKNVSPLELALVTIRAASKFENVNGSISAVRIISLLCAPAMRNHMETLRLLAQKSGLVKEQLNRHLMNGDIAQVGALLLVAKSRVLPSVEDNSGFNSLKDMHNFLLSSYLDAVKSPSAAGAESTSAATSFTQLHRQYKLRQMRETLRLLEILDTIGDKIGAWMRIHPVSGFSRLDSAVLYLIQDAGFDVTLEDIYDTNCGHRLRVPYYLSPVKQLEDFLIECNKKLSNEHLLPSWLREKSLTQSTTNSPLKRDAPPERGVSLSSRERVPQLLADSLANFMPSYTRAYTKSWRFLRRVHV